MLGDGAGLSNKEKGYVRLDWTPLASSLHAHFLLERWEGESFGRVPSRVNEVMSRVTKK